MLDPALVRVQAEVSAAGPGELAVTLGGETTRCREAVCELAEVVDTDTEAMDAVIFNVSPDPMSVVTTWGADCPDLDEERMEAVLELSGGTVVFACRVTFGQPDPVEVIFEFRDEATDALFPEGPLGVGVSPLDESWPAGCENQDGRCSELLVPGRYRVEALSDPNGPVFSSWGDCRGETATAEIMPRDEPDATVELAREPMTCIVYYRDES